MRVFPRLARLGSAFFAAAMLAGCLVSETPLLNDLNAPARPLDAGPHMSCQYENGEDGDCLPLDVSVRGALYVFQPLEEGEDPTLARFRALSGGGFLVQMSGEEGGGYWYFYADRLKDGVRLVMIDCENLPAKLRDRLAAKGALVVEDGGRSCVAKTLAGAEQAAKAYRGRNAVAAQTFMTITKVEQ